MKQRDRLSRRPPKRDPKKRFLIVCEGKVTEREYFDHTGHLFRHVILEISPGGDPKSLVERAIEKKKDSEEKAKKDANELYDQIWCVCDVDEHPRLPDARQQARDNKIKMAVSNPCFELWALLHFQDQNAHIGRAKVRALCKEHMPGYHKRLPCELLLPLYSDALRRSTELDRRYTADSREGANPSTGVYKLTEEIRSQPA
jgi:hypothetical protein